MKKINILLILVQFIFLISCNEKNNNIDTHNSSITIISNEESSVYNTVEAPPLNDINNIINYIYANDKIFIFGETTEGNVQICETDGNFSYYKNTDLDLNYSPDDSVAIVNSDKEIFIVNSHKDGMNDDAEYTYSISIFDFEGNKIEDNIMNLDTESFKENQSANTIDKLLYIDDNELICVANRKFFAVNRKGDILKEAEINAEYNFADIAISADGQSFALLSNKNTDDYLYNFNMNELTVDSYGNKLNINGVLVNGADDYILYIYNSEAIYGISQNNTAEKLVDLNLSGINITSRILPLSNDEFLFTSGQKIIKITKNNNELQNEIQQIKLAVIDDTQSIQGLVKYYNTVSNRYKVELIDYSDDYEYSIEGLAGAVSEFERDIILGNIPDLVWLDTNEIQKLSGKEMFVDLYKYMENDSVYTKSAFLPNYLEAAETDGHLYSISPSFLVKTIAAKEKWINQTNWNIDNFIKSYYSFNQKMSLFPTGNNNVAVLNFITNNGSNYVDYKNYTCCFNSDEFINALEFSKKFPNVEQYDFEQYSCKNDTALLSAMYIKSFRDINVQKQCIFGNDKISFVGFPSDIGNGSMMLLSKQFAIMGESDNKDGAWDFIRFQFNDEFYKQTRDGFPVTEKGLQIVMEEALERPYFIEENGEKYYWDEEGIDLYSNTPIPIDLMTRTDRDCYEDFIRSINIITAGNNDSEINNIMNEETLAFFADEFTAEQCAEIIQNRVSILLSEQS